jgi:hypothetical protein
MSPAAAILMHCQTTPSVRAPWAPTPSPAAAILMHCQTTPP